MIYSNENKIDWNDPSINARAMFRTPRKFEPAVDEIVSQIVGKKIYQQDPRLIKLIIKWKAGKPIDSMEPDNFFSDPHKIEELKRVLGENLC